MSVYQNLIAGRTPKKTMSIIQDFGLGSMHEVISGTLGGKRSTTATFSLFDQYARMLQSDPVGFVKDALLPLQASHGVTSEAAILNTVNDLASNRNASGQLSIISTQMV
jgi:hypothetical protein